MSKKNQIKDIRNVSVEAMKKSKGRFFGLYFNDGTCINAQFRKETPETVVVYDRTNKSTRRVYKDSIASVNI
jgi:hypothetical protein